MAISVSTWSEDQVHPEAVPQSTWKEACFFSLASFEAREFLVQKRLGGWMSQNLVIWPKLALDDKASPTTPGYMKRITWKGFLIKHNLAKPVASDWHTLNLPFLLCAVLSSSLADKACFLSLDRESAGDVSAQVSALRYFYCTKDLWYFIPTVGLVLIRGRRYIS